MNTAIWIPIAVVVLVIVVIALYLWVTRNALVTLAARVDEAWRDITAQVQRRADLLPKLLEMIGGYAQNDRVALDAVTTARAESLAATTSEEVSTAENHMQQALRSVFAIAQGYPKLQSSPEFLQLQGDIADSEERIQASRRFYNGGVREFNTRIQVIPARMFARRLGFAPREFFEAGTAAGISEPPRVQF